jgi:ribosomal protein S15P/S13E
MNLISLAMKINEFIGDKVVSEYEIQNKFGLKRIGSGISRDVFRKGKNVIKVEFCRQTKKNILSNVNLYEYIFYQASIGTNYEKLLAPTTWISPSGRVSIQQYIPYTVFAYQHPNFAFEFIANVFSCMKEYNNENSVYNDFHEGNIRRCKDHTLRLIDYPHLIAPRKITSITKEIKKLHKHLKAHDQMVKFYLNQNKLVTIETNQGCYTA